MAVLDWLQQLLGGGQAGEETAAAGRTAAMQPGVSQWMQGIGSDLRQAVPPSTYDPSRSLAQNALNPRGLEQALNVALGINPSGLATYPAFKGMYPYDWHKTPITDAAGNIVRAGTYEPVTQFQSTNGPYAGFFSDSPDVASRFARAFQGAVYPTRITMDNPAIIDAGGKPSGAFQFADMAREHGTIDDMKLFHRATRDPRSNYDGVILKNTKDEGTVYVPRNSQQVRSIFEDNSAGLLGAAEQQ